MTTWIDQYHCVVWNEQDAASEEWWRDLAVWDDMLIDGCDFDEFDGSWMILL